jgi:tripartite-type tricarboxylate transporter receptor subunit TctC
MVTMKSIATIALLAALALPCAAQDKAVRILIGFPPGGTTDLLGRVLADKLKDDLGQTVLVENRPGAIAAIAAEAVKNAPPDGGTLLLNVVGSMIVAPNARKTNTFDTLRDFAPVSLVTTSHLALAVGPAVPAKTLKEFLDWARANRGKAFYATSGAGSLPHMLGLLLAREARVELTHVPYKGTAAYINELIGGQVPAAFDALGDLSEQHRAGKLRIIAIAGSARSKAMPELPTMREQGIAVEGMAWFGLFAPAATPRAIQDRISGAVAKALQHPEVAARLVTLNMEPVGSTPEAFRKVVQDDWTKWGAIVKASGFTLD